MTPKEKAEELVRKMCLNDCTIKNIDKAKQCALIAVDEIIESYEFDSLYIEHKRIMDNINFWDEAKQEIEKL